MRLKSTWKPRKGLGLFASLFASQLSFQLSTLSSLMYCSLVCTIVELFQQKLEWFQKFPSCKLYGPCTHVPCSPNSMKISLRVYANLWTKPVERKHLCKQCNIFRTVSPQMFCGAYYIFIGFPYFAVTERFDTKFPRIIYVILYYSISCF